MQAKSSGLYRTKFYMGLKRKKPFLYMSQRGYSMIEINFLIHNLIQTMPLYDRQQPKRVVDLMVEKWTKQRYTQFIKVQSIALPERQSRFQTPKH